MRTAQLNDSSGIGDDAAHSSRLLRGRSKEESTTFSSQGKKKRKLKLMMINNNDDDDGDDDDDASSRKSIKSGPHGKSSDECSSPVDLLAVPRKARTATTKRPQDQPDSKHNSCSMPCPGNAADVPRQPKKPNSHKEKDKVRAPKFPKICTKNISEQEVEIAAVLFDLSRALPPLLAQTKPESQVEELKDEHNKPAMAIDATSSQAFSPHSALPTAEEAPPRKKYQRMRRKQEDCTIAHSPLSLCQLPSVSNGGEPEGILEEASHSLESERSDGKIEASNPSPFTPLPCSPLNANSLPISQSTNQKPLNVKSNIAETDAPTTNSPSPEIEEKTELSPELNPDNKEKKVTVEPPSESIKSQSQTLPNTCLPKFEINLMNPPTGITSLEDEKVEEGPKVSRVERVAKDDATNSATKNLWTDEGRENKMQREEKVHVADSTDLSRIDENKLRNESPRKGEKEIQNNIPNEGKRENEKVEQPSQRAIKSAKAEKSGGSSSLQDLNSHLAEATTHTDSKNPPVSVSMGMEGLPSSLGRYYTPAATWPGVTTAINGGVVDYSGASAVHVMAPRFIFSEEQKTPKRCASHAYIAHFIELQQHRRRAASTHQQYKLIHTRNASIASFESQANGLQGGSVKETDVGLSSTITTTPPSSFSSTLVEAGSREREAMPQHSSQEVGSSFQFPITQAAASSLVPSTVVTRSLEGIAANALTQAQNLQAAAMLQHHGGGGFPVPFSPPTHFTPHISLQHQDTHFLGNSYYASPINPALMTGFCSKMQQQLSNNYSQGLTSSSGKMHTQHASSLGPNVDVETDSKGSHSIIGSPAKQPSIPQTQQQNHHHHMHQQKTGKLLTQQDTRVHSENNYDASVVSICRKQDHVETSKSPNKRNPAFDIESASSNGRMSSSLNMKNTPFGNMKPGLAAANLSNQSLKPKTLGTALVNTSLSFSAQQSANAAESKNTRQGNIVIECDSSMKSPQMASMGESRSVSNKLSASVLPKHPHELHQTGGHLSFLDTVTRSRHSSSSIIPTSPVSDSPLKSNTGMNGCLSSSPNLSFVESSFVVDRSTTTSHNGKKFQRQNLQQNLTSLDIGQRQSMAQLYFNQQQGYANQLMTHSSTKPVQMKHNHFLQQQIYQQSVPRSSSSSGSQSDSQHHRQGSNRVQLLTASADGSTGHSFPSLSQTIPIQKRSSLPAKPSMNVGDLPIGSGSNINNNTGESTFLQRQMNSTSNTGSAQEQAGSSLGRLVQSSLGFNMLPHSPQIGVSSMKQASIQHFPGVMASLGSQSGMAGLGTVALSASSSSNSVKTSVDTSKQGKATQGGQPNPAPLLSSMTATNMGETKC